MERVIAEFRLDVFVFWVKVELLVEALVLQELEFTLEKEFTLEIIEY